MDVIDNAQTAVINFHSGKDQFLGLPSRNLHVQYAQVTVPCMSFDLSKAVAGSAQSAGQLTSSACDKRRQLVAESQTLLNRYSQESSARKAQAVGQSVHGMIDVQKDLGDRGDVHDRLEETQDSRKSAPSLHYGDGADCVQCHIGYSRQHDQPKREEYRGVHW